MQLVDKSISLATLTKMSEKMFGQLVKAVVDIEQNIMLVDADFHADEEQLLLEAHNSEQKNLWGINLHPDKWGTPEFVEFDSMINVRPSMGNRTRGVEDVRVQEVIRKIVLALVTP